VPPFFYSRNMDKNFIVFGDAQNMKEIGDESVHLVVTSPPYFNAPFDYPDMFENYEEFLGIMRNVTREIMRVLKWGRVAALVVDDTLIKGKKYPVVADIFRYRERIVWVKPEGYICITIPTTSKSPY